MRINVLPYIALCLSKFPYHDCSDMSRADLMKWLDGLYMANSHKPYKSLIVDALIAAGIGNDSEQERTVFCECYHPY